MAGHTTTSNGSHHLEMSPMQPRSLLHAIPQELRDAIFALAVVSPTPLPARILLRDVEISDDKTTATHAGSTASSSNATTTSQRTRIGTQIRITPPQPALSLVDRKTRSQVLRIFYKENTFLFRKHTYDNLPARTWLEATTANAYTPLATLIQHVQIETCVRKACTLPNSLTHNQMMQLPREEHTYTITISPRSQPRLDSSGHSISFSSDLSKMCSCALRSAGLMFRPSLKLTDATPASFAGVLTTQDQDPESHSSSLSLQFAADIEDDVLLEGPCRWQLCSRSSMTTCRRCSRLIHNAEPLGLDLLKWYEKAAKRERREAARQARLEASRLRQEAERAKRDAELEAAKAEREAHRVRAAMALQAAQKRVAETGGEALFDFIMAKGQEEEARRERAATALREAETRGESSAAGALRESAAIYEAMIDGGEEEEDVDVEGEGDRGKPKECIVM